VWVDPILMAKALKAISAVGCDEDHEAVEILINVEKPLMIRAHNRSDGIKADVIMMPMETEKKQECQKSETADETRVEPAEVAQLREELEKMKGERDFLNEELDKAKHRVEGLNSDAERHLMANERLREVLEGRENQITELVRERNALREQLQTAIKTSCDRPVITGTPVSGMSRRERLQLVRGQS
jgi:hypothetical protein